MIIKIFSNRGGGSAGASLNYLLDKAKGEVEILQGDPKLSKKIAENLPFKNKYTVGVLSFEEKPSQITEQQKRAVISKFEDVIFAGLDKDQYNISWIQHTDKGRLELNFFIPNVELRSGKRLQPYYDKADRPLLDSFKKVVNYEQNFSDPDSPERRQAFILDMNTHKTKQEAIRAISDFILIQVSSGKINAREDVLEALKSNGLEIARVTSKSISIKDPDGGQNIRLKGALYEENFRADKYLTAEYRRAVEEYQRERPASYERARERLDAEVTKREREYRGRYAGGKESLDSFDKNLAKTSKMDSAKFDYYPSDSLRNTDNSFNQDLSRNGGSESISRDLQSPEQRNDIQGMPNEAGHQTLRDDRSELQGSSVGRGSIESGRDSSHETTNQNEQVGEANDRIGTTFFEHIKEFGRGLLERASGIIENLREVGERLFSVEGRASADDQTIQHNERTISENERAISTNEPALQRNEIAISNAKSKDFDLTL